MESKRQILVVEDDQRLADLLQDYLQQQGFDVAFMDIMMPGRNGVESFMEIKKMRPDAKVYMMTGFSVNELVEKAVDNGAMGVFSKPVDLERVFTVLEELAA